MIPTAAPGNTMDDVVTARFDYSKLDQEGSAVRLRLDSTVIKAQHDGDPKTATQVSVTYIRGGHAYRVKARSCVLACYHAAIPYLCPELPGPQREALALQVKVPIQYSTVALRDWRAWKKLGIGGVVAPGSYHTVAMLDFPVSLGEYSYAKNPDEPILVHMERFPHRNNGGHTANEQHRLARHDMLSESFESVERNIRSQLAGLLAPGGFDPARDIAGISVNRWAHGYANFGNSLFSPTYADDDDARYPHMQARKRFGRIAIANSDAAATPMLEAAVEQGYRAVSELTPP